MSDTTPDADNAPLTVVLVHGAFADASGWAGLIQRLQAAGVLIAAPPNPLRSVSHDAAHGGSLLNQIPVLANGHDASQPPVVEVPSREALRLGLTLREVEVLRLLAEGLSDRGIADALSISERTAGNHVQHAMQKIGVESRTAAAVFAVRHNLG